MLKSAGSGGIPAPCVLRPPANFSECVESNHPLWDGYSPVVCSTNSDGPGFFHVHTCSQLVAARLDEMHCIDPVPAPGLHHMRRDHSSHPAPRNAGQYSSAIGYSHGSGVPTISWADTM